MAEGIPTTGRQDGGQDGPGGEEPETRPADDVESADEDGGGSDDGLPALYLDEVEEETEAERGLEDIADKLRGLRDRISWDRDAAQNKLRRADAEIDRLDAVMGRTETERDEACSAHGLASGYINGIRHAISTLRSNDASNPTTVLRNLIEGQKSAALALATRLVGDELAVSLVADREALLGSEPHTAVRKIFQRAQGLIREFRALNDETDKQEGVVRIAELNAALSPDKPEVAEAKVALATLRGKKEGIETDVKSLLTQLVAVSRVSAVLETSMGSANSAAATLEGQLSELTTTEAASLLTYTSINERLSDERIGLEEARSGKTTAERTMGLLQDQLAEIDDLMKRLSSVSATLNAARPLVAGAAESGNLYGMTYGIGEDMEEYEKNVLGPINYIGSGVIVAPIVNTRLMHIMTTTRAHLHNMRKALARAGERLQELVGVLSNSIETADDGDTVQLGAVEDVLANAARVQRFIDEEWPELEAGDQGTIRAVGEAVKKAMKNVLGPLEPLADFLETGSPDTWIEFLAWRAARAEAATEELEAAATGGEEAGAESTATTPDAGADAGAATETAPDGGTGSVATSRDPLSAVGAADDGDDVDLGPDADVDAAADADADTDGTEAGDEPEDVAVTEVGASTEPPVDGATGTPDAPAGGAEPAVATTPRKRTTKK